MRAARNLMGSVPRIAIAATRKCPVTGTRVAVRSIRGAAIMQGGVIRFGKYAGREAELVRN